MSSAVLASSARFTSPVVRIPNVEPFVGKKLSASDVPFGVPDGGTAAKDAAVSTPGFASMALASAEAPVRHR